MAGRRFQSLFHQKLDRALFGAYFAGAVLPLVVCAVAVNLLALPLMERDAAQTTIGVLICSGGLALVGYFAVRRLARVALEQMNGDNNRLAQLLATSRAFSGAHAEEVAANAADCARALTDSTSAAVLLVGEKDEELVRAAAAGTVATLDEFDNELSDLAASAVRDNRPAQLSFDGASPGRKTALAVPIVSETQPGAIVVVRDRPGAKPFESSDLDALDTLAALAGIAVDNADLQVSQRNFFAHVTDILVTALDAHVDRRDGHAAQVAMLANALARELRLDEEQSRRLHFAALLHDIGMLKIATEHQRDRAFFEKHSALGARMLSRIRLWRDAAPVVLHHHEHFDGSGYPNGLVADAIPVESRIILVADAFDAMTRDDTHRSARPVAEALQELRDGMGTQFDPDVVRAFLELAQRGDLPAR